MLSKLCEQRRHGYLSQHVSLLAIASATPCIVGVTSHARATCCSLCRNYASTHSEDRSASLALSSQPPTTANVGTYNLSSAFEASDHPCKENITLRSAADRQGPGSRNPKGTLSPKPFFASVASLHANTCQSEASADDVDPS